MQRTDSFRGPHEAKVDAKRRLEWTPERPPRQGCIPGERILELIDKCSKLLIVPYLPECTAIDRARSESQDDLAIATGNRI
jgi:hypothetical protein